jgi:hypothetical protein
LSALRLCYVANGDLRTVRKMKEDDTRVDRQSTSNVALPQGGSELASASVTPTRTK